MSRVIRRTKQMRRDIIDIYGYLYDRSPRAADGVFDAIERSIRSLSDAPGVGTYWNSPDPRLDGVKVTPVRKYRSYLIFFRLTGDGIEVLRVIHGARDLKPLLDAMELDFEDEG